MLLKRIVCWFIGHHLEFDRLESGIPIRRCRQAAAREIRRCNDAGSWPSDARRKTKQARTPGGITM